MQIKFDHFFCFSVSLFCSLTLSSILTLSRLCSLAIFPFSFLSLFSFLIFSCENVSIKKSFFVTTPFDSKINSNVKEFNLGLVEIHSHVCEREREREIDTRERVRERESVSVSIRENGKVGEREDKRVTVTVII